MPSASPISRPNWPPFSPDFNPMLYIISITLSLLGGFVAGLLVARKHGERLKASEAEGRKLLDALKGK